MKDSRGKEILCEVCNKEPATSFSFLGDEYKYHCLYGGDCTAGIEKYYIEFEGFFKSSKSIIDWMCHLNEKRWYNHDNFIQKLKRFR